MGDVDRQSDSIELSIEQAKEAIATMEALDRLTKNPDFAKLVLKGYFEEHAYRLVSARANPSMQSDEMQKATLKSIDAIGEFKVYCNNINQMGMTAERAMEADEQTREELLAEAV